MNIRAAQEGQRQLRLLRIMAKASKHTSKLLSFIHALLNGTEALVQYSTMMRNLHSTFA